MSSIASNKLTRANVERLLSPTVFITVNGQVVEVENTTSANDIQLYIELSKRQDCMGRIDGVTYSDFMELLDCSKATFYNSLYRLERLEYISATPDRKGYWSITILNNIFLTKKDYKQSYMRTNVDFLYSDSFKKMSCVEKKLCLYLHLNKNPREKLERYACKLAKAIGVKIVSVINAALDRVKEFFPHDIVKGSQGNKIVFNGSNIAKNIATETSNYIAHKLKQFCKENKIKHTSNDIEDVSTVASQYSHTVSYKKFMQIVLHVVYESTIDKSLVPNYINHLCNLETKRKKAVSNSENI